MVGMNNNLNSINFVLFTSTKGHFGIKDCFEKTVERLEDLGSYFFHKFAHIKVSQGEESIGDLMKNWLKNHKWNTELGFGNWSHDSPSHAVEYFFDIQKMLNKKEILEKEYCLLLEDDWLINSLEFLPLLEEGVDCLNKNRDLLAIRIEREGQGNIENCEQISRSILRHNLNYSQYGPTFTFQPTLVRTRSWSHAINFFWNNKFLIDKLSMGELHCELLATQLLKLISNTDRPFCSFDMKLINATHIGEINYGK